MFTKAAFIKSLKTEAKIIKHLATQVPAGQLDYKPTPAQRSTIDLLRYLTTGGITSAIFATTGTWDHWEKLDAEAKKVDLATFAKAMDRQTKAIEKLLAKETDKTLQKKMIKTWGGEKVTLGEGLIVMVLNQFVAYRTQLFLYAKASGASHIGTSDLWRGKAAKPKKAAASG
ncbi:MAG: hypothetical protein H0W83_10715 [Planctomycetes bacterium]|nr:hypothetical protein [Planctomycetota bacterium]